MYFTVERSFYHFKIVSKTFLGLYKNFNIDMNNLTIKNTLAKKFFNLFLDRNSKTFISMAKNSLINQQFKSLSRGSFLWSSKRLENLNFQQRFLFSSQKKGPLKPEDIPQQNLQIAVTEQKLQDEEVQVIHTKGTLSILDKVPGPKNPETGELYVLMFTCGQCNAKQIKSFTKNAYHKGVVLARCVGCDKVHLVADNLGWFEDQPTNVETLHEGKVKKVHDHAAINAFLSKAFSEEEKLLHEQSKAQQESTQNKEK